MNKRQIHFASINTASNELETRPVCYYQWTGVALTHWKIEIEDRCQLANTKDLENFTIRVTRFAAAITCSAL